jgi:heme/copper-type cytochrome/quinol oxidase subunit 2
VGSRARLVLLVATVLAAVVLFLALRPGDEEPTRSATTTSETTTSTGTGTETETETETNTTTTAETPSAVRIRIQARGDGSGSIRRVTIERGQRVTLIVSADVADEVHVHGYDLMADVAPGSPARISFEASVPGRFEVELETRAIQIAELRVGP